MLSKSEVGTWFEIHEVLIGSVLKIKPKKIKKKIRGLVSKNQTSNFLNFEPGSFDAYFFKNGKKKKRYHFFYVMTQIWTLAEQGQQSRMIYKPTST